MRIRVLALALFAVLCSGCGTLTTVAQQDSVARNNLKDYRSYCKSIPRIYSGVSYDVCKLYGVPNPGAQSIYAIPALFIDIVLSGVLDTVALPYTIYTQSDRGSIVIQR